MLLSRLLGPIFGPVALITTLPTIGREAGEALELAGEDIGLGAAFTLGQASGNISSGANLVKYGALALGAVVLIAGFGFLKEAVK